MDQIRVGTWTIAVDGIEVVTYGETASHYTRTKIEPGEYPVYARRAQNGYVYLSVDVTGTVIDGYPRQKREPYKPNLSPYFYQLKEELFFNGGKLSVCGLSKEEGEILANWVSFSTSI